MNFLGLVRMTFGLVHQGFSGKPENWFSLHPASAGFYKAHGHLYIPLNLSFLLPLSSAEFSCMVDGGGMRLLSNLGILGVNAWTMDMILESFGSINGNWVGMTGITGAFA